MQSPSKAIQTELRWWRAKSTGIASTAASSRERSKVLSCSFSIISQSESLSDYKDHLTILNESER